MRAASLSYKWHNVLHFIYLFIYLFYMTMYLHEPASVLNVLIAESAEKICCTSSLISFYGSLSQNGFDHSPLHLLLLRVCLQTFINNSSSTLKQKEFSLLVWLSVWVILRCLTNTGPEISNIESLWQIQYKKLYFHCLLQQLPGLHQKHPRHFMFLSASTWTQCGINHKETIDWIQRAVSLWCWCPNAVGLW